MVASARAVFESSENGAVRMSMNPARKQNRIVHSTVSLPTLRSFDPG
jgi:hypothetical protein